MGNKPLRVFHRLWRQVAEVRRQIERPLDRTGRIIGVVWNEAGSMGLTDHAPTKRFEIQGRLRDGCDEIGRLNQEGCGQRRHAKSFCLAFIDAVRFQTAGRR